MKFVLNIHEVETFNDRNSQFCFHSFRYRARNNNGQVGLVPRNYLQELSEYLAQPYRGCPQGGDSIDRRNDQLPPPPNNANQPERPNLVGKPWYYGAITRNQCDTVLNSHGHDGDYLIRDSETNVSHSSYFFLINIESEIFIGHLFTLFVF